MISCATKKAINDKDLMHVFASDPYHWSLPTERYPCLELGIEVDSVFGPSIHLAVTMLSTKNANLDYQHAAKSIFARTSAADSNAAERKKASILYIVCLLPDQLWMGWKSA